jgi:CRISPR-associated protein Cmr4
MDAQLTFVHAFSPLHAGTGQGVGVIDLPIAREKATGLPFLPGSSLKGALRARCGDDNCVKVFGTETTDDNNNASAAQFSDQRLLLIPIRSLAGTFSWVTSPYVLQRFVRDLQDTGITPPASITFELPDNLPLDQHAGHCFVSNEHSKIMLTNSQIFLEDLDLTPHTSQDAADWGNWIGKQVFPDDSTWQAMVADRICIVHDDILTFLLDTATEVTARIKMQANTKTVQSGGLWYEEALPAETILSGLVLAIPSEKINTEEVFEVLNELTGKTIQLGGKATIGRGLCHVQLTNREA